MGRPRSPLFPFAHRTARPFIFCCIHDCEKLSEIVMSFERTIHMSFRASCGSLPRRPPAKDLRGNKSEGYGKANENHDRNRLFAGPAGTKSAACMVPAVRGRRRNDSHRRHRGDLEPGATGGRGVARVEEIHRSQTADGAQLICLNSLLKRVQKPKLLSASAAQT